ncbi:hypothetical protein B5M09_012736 [Aphanomyces astaci]|uniref:No apical meristem-associated C-terminal domain-containing protein n=1 Tax=Aphanomyces astaci TaxID=112090 RepID=A0A3R7X808_APHAT|nr:hypothetical protein B5M09_012736 [Aphanomyces astaci]
MSTIDSRANPVVQVDDAQSRPGKFDCFHDIQLLKQVNLSKPWEAGYGKVMAAWVEVCREVIRIPGYKINKKPEGLKTRFDLLIKTHCEGEVASMRKSGTSEDYTEKDLLLTDIKARMDDFDETAAARKDNVKRKIDSIVNSGALMRRMAMGNLDAQGDEKDETPRKKKKNQAPSLSCLMDTIKHGINEKVKREAKHAELLEERLTFDTAQAQRHEKPHQDHQLIMQQLLASLIKK